MPIWSFAHACPLVRLVRNGPNGTRGTADVLIDWRGLGPGSKYVLYRGSFLGFVNVLGWSRKFRRKNKLLFVLTVFYTFDAIYEKVRLPFSGCRIEDIKVSRYIPISRASNRTQWPGPTFQKNVCFCICIRYYEISKIAKDILQKFRGGLSAKKQMYV